jgi:hypothetical protein
MLVVKMNGSQNRRPGLAGAILLASATLMACGARDIGWYGVDTSKASNVGGSGAGGNGSGGIAVNVGGSGVGGNGSGGIAVNVGGNGSGGIAVNVGGSGVGGSGTGGIAVNVGGNGAGGGGPLENCTNGLDDDMDGDIDCEDTDCDAGFSCTDPVPPGWTGPVALWEGNGNLPPPPCGLSGGFDSIAASGSDGLSASPASCPSCSCGAPQGVACQIGTASFYSNAMCVGGGGQLSIPEGVCQAFVTSTIDPAGVMWNAAPPGGGACFPITTGTVSVPSVVWAERARSCGGLTDIGDGCGGGLCVPRPQIPFAEPVCVYRAGDQSCPAAYPDKALYFQSADDTRSCTSCGCGTPTGTSCGGTLQLYTDNNCNVDEVTLSTVGQCAALPPDPTPPPPPYFSLRSMKYTGGSNNGGSCASQASNRTGTVNAISPVTFCCAP